MSVTAERRKAARAQAFTSPAPARPPLENGASLEAEEFLRRYEQMPDTKKAELVDGMVYVASPVTIYHGEADGIVQAWLGQFAVLANGVKLLVNTTLLLDSRNTVQPDAMLVSGEIEKTDDGYLLSVPSFIAEIALSSASLDLNRKLEAYRRHGIPEYLVWRPHEEALDWFVLDVAGHYISRHPDTDGFLRSRGFPGLVLDAQALLRFDSRAVLDALVRVRT